MNAEITFVYDTDLRRPACVLLQAAMGGSIGSEFHSVFGASNWLLAPTPGMKKLSATKEQWLQVVRAEKKICN